MRIRTAKHGLVLALLALPGPLLYVAYTLGLCLSVVGMPFLGERVVARCRAAVDRSRRLSGAWCEVPIATSYHPAPPDPQPDAEGWYRYDKRLYRTPRVPRYMERVHWLSEDPATGRDMSWLLLNTVVGPALGLLAVVGSGCSGSTGGGRVHGWARLSCARGSCGSAGDCAISGGWRSSPCWRS
ncbi:sensor domain-containing protein [Saccharopolyspora sp. NPDC002376]